MDEIIFAVRNKLKSFGYEVTSDDEWLLNFCAEKVNQHIKNFCSTPNVPKELFYVAVDRVCGEFLNALNASGKLEIETLDLDGAVTQIREGDTTIQFANGTSDNEKFSFFVNYLMNEGKGDFVCYRKIKW